MEPTPTKKRLPELFNITQQNNNLVFRSGDALNDARWGAWFGEIQSILRSGEYNKEHFTQCHIDISQCCWADPLPILSLSLTLIEYEYNKGHVDVTLPENPNCNPNVSVTQGTHQQDQARFMKFLAREGFLNLLTNPKIVNIPCNSFETRSFNRTIRLGTIDYDVGKHPSLLRELPVSLAFERSTCLLATILDLSCPVDEDDPKPLEAIDEWVEKVLFQNISPAINEEVPSWAQDDLRYRLMTFLRETLHNVVEHAHSGRGSELAAVYVRYREGALGESPENWQRLTRFTKREERNTEVPLMKTRDQSESFLNTRTGFFEVFVIDSGQGLCHSFGEHSAQNDSNLVHQTMLDVFKRGASSKKNRPTQYGGLYLIGELLTPNEDYFRVRDEDMWWATQLPLKDKETQSERSGQITQNAYGKEHGNNGIKGLAWTARLSWLEAQDMTTHNSPWCGIDNKEDQKKLLRVYRNNGTENPVGNVTDIPVYDARFSSYPPCINLQISPDNNDPALLFLPPPKLMKNHIQDEIGHYLKQLPPLVKNLTLVIGDIPSEEATAYLAAINKAYKFKNTPFLAVKRVVLVTRALRVCILKRNNSNGLLIPNANESKKYISSNKTIGTLIHRNLPDYLYKLRKHDGYRLSLMMTDQSKDLKYMDFLAEEVDWHDGIILRHGYLDFPQTLTNPLFQKIYALSLQRLTGLFPRFDCKLFGLDSLVDSLVTRFNAQIHPRHSLKSNPRKTQAIHIGSIKVSGYTEQAEKQPDIPVFHFFRHPDGNAVGRFLLPWIGSAETAKPNPVDAPFRRVGKTPVIARDGWKAYSLPRFIRVSPSEYQSAYEKNPRDSYRAWQEPSRNPMKLGHWSYGGHHEILTINLLLAFDTDLDRISLVLGGSLDRFTYANLFRIFGIKEEDLNQQNKTLFNKIKEDNYRHLLPAEIGTKEPLLVYPSHPVTDHIIDCFLGLLSENAMKNVRSRLIGILPIRRHRTGSGLQVSGISLERLRITAKTDIPVVFFDDGVISGRTYEEVKRLLRSIGYRDVYSLVLLDRQRLPSVDYLEDGKHICYWRLDVPSLGGRAHCPLCHAIDRVRALSDSIVSQEHKKRITDSWCDTWKELDPSTEWGDAGLRPIPLTLNKPERRFGIARNPDGTYSQIGGEAQQIRLTNSAGLIAWVTELHTITSRDDLPFSLLKKEAEALSSEVRIQLLSSQLLLFFEEFDSDHAREMGVALMEALWESSKHDRHTALAALTLISCGDDFLEEVMDKFLSSERLDQLKDRNLDFVLLTALKLAVERRDSKQLENDSRYDVASRLLKPCGKPDLYYRLHREIKDTLGKAHSSPLHRLIQTQNDVETLTLESLMNSLGSAAQVLALVNEIPRHSLRPGTVAHREYSSIKNDIEQKEIKLRRAIEGVRMFSSAGACKRSKFLCIAKGRGKQLLREGNKLHEGLFVPLNIHEIQKGNISPILEVFVQLSYEFLTEKAISRKIEWHYPDKNSTQQLYCELNAKNKDINEAYIVWDTDVLEAIKDILSNVRHVDENESILDPWNSTSNSKAHIWCRVIMNEYRLYIEMKNTCKKNSIEKIRELTHNHHSHHIISEIGGKVDFELNNRILLTTVSLPYAHTLQTLPKENDND